MRSERACEEPAEAAGKVVGLLPKGKGEWARSVSRLRRVGSVHSVRVLIVLEVK